MALKNTVRGVHLTLGLLSGLVITFLGVTGCILAFQREIENAVQDYRHVTPREQAPLPPSRLKAIAEKELPAKQVHSVLYAGRQKAAQAIFYHGEPESYYYIVYLDPYDGRVLKVKDMDRDFFRQVVMGHFYLWLPPRIGQPVVASATLVFVVMMLSGLVLWWPRNRAARRQRFTIKWNARWRRKNYDLHNVLGFYMTWVAVVLAFTGLVWGFEWFADSVYRVAGGKNSRAYHEPLSDTGRSAAGGTPAMDAVWQRMKKEYPSAQVLEVHVQEGRSSCIMANANPDAGTYWKTDYRYFDQYSLKELPAQSIYGKLREAKAADRLLRMNYDLHTGGIAGLAGKILMFFASLVAASLPVTGFMIWRGRRRKSKSMVVPGVAVPVAG